MRGVAVSANPKPRQKIFKVSRPMGKFRLKVDLKPVFRRVRKKDYVAARHINWKQLGLEEISAEKKAVFAKWLRKAEAAAPAVADFAEFVLEKARKGVLKGNLVFIGRDAVPIYHAACILAPKYGIGERRLVLINIPARFAAARPAEWLFRYMKELGAFSGKQVTLVDASGVGNFMKRLKSAIASNSKIEVGSIQLATLRPWLHRSMLMEKPLSVSKISKAVVSLGTQPHPKKKPKVEMVLGEEAVVETQKSMRFVAGAEEVKKIIEREARRRL